MIYLAWVVLEDRPLISKRGNNAFHISCYQLKHGCRKQSTKKKNHFIYVDIVLVLISVYYIAFNILIILRNLFFYLLLVYLISLLIITLIMWLIDKTHQFKRCIWKEWKISGIIIGICLIHLGFLGIMVQSKLLECTFIPEWICLFEKKKHILNF